jgi:hypothetical protein
VPTPLSRTALLAFSLFLPLAPALAAGCASTDESTGAGPGSTQPGQPCTGPADCGCWECTCKGVDGGPGAAQLCIGDICPTGQTACTVVCMTSGAQVEQATAIDTCPAVP